jgi:5-hydroxyisourate hydrolase
MQISLIAIEDEQRRVLKEIKTNADGRCPEPLLEGANLRAGHYELLFQVGQYFKDMKVTTGQPFLEEVPVRFTITDISAHYHVPLLVSPWSYTTYRGS